MERYSNNWIPFVHQIIALLMLSSAYMKHVNAWPVNKNLIKSRNNLVHRAVKIPSYGLFYDLPCTMYKIVLQNEINRISLGQSKPEVSKKSNDKCLVKCTLQRDALHSNKVKLNLCTWLKYFMNVFVQGKFMVSVIYSLRKLYLEIKLTYNQTCVQLNNINRVFRN